MKETFDLLAESRRSYISVGSIFSVAYSYEPKSSESFATTK